MTYRKLAQINIKGKFVANEVKLVVLGGRVHQVETAANVLARTLRDKLQRKRVPAGLNAISTGVVGSVQDTVAGASLVVRAKRSVPGVTSVAYVLRNQFQLSSKSAAYIRKHRPGSKRHYVQLV